MTEPDFSRCRLAWSETLNVDGQAFVVDEILAGLSPHLTDERRARIARVVEGRSLGLVPLLENIYDRGNVSAVMRSCEAFGFLQMYLVDAPGARFKAANRVTRGAEKWLDVRAGTDPASAVAELKGRGYQVWATDLATDVSIDRLDWDRPLAVVLGNEKDGISPAMASLVDGCFRIPMLGFSQSFNISVAAALIFYRAFLEQSRRGGVGLLGEAARRQVLANYYLRCFDNPGKLLLERRARS